ncbi:MAG: beta-ketoacyl-[acyl-carrier-protein] synthase family protein [Candidatus Caenarcaniphilales bacterium]|nr:beta-ketoacyl-[acyl-carrier-protein] synthase family protein [Candidatus Caenarcaniphilales bacterium]
MDRRVVITGMGGVTPVGCEVDEIWSNLINGISGIKHISLFEPDEFNMDARIAGEVKNFSIANFFPAERADSMIKDMDRVTLFCVAASKGAVEDARLPEALSSETIDPTMVSIFVGTGIGGITTTSADIYKLIYQGPKKVGVRSIIRLMPNAPAGQVGIEFGLKGQAKSESTACASGLDAMVDAFYNIKSGLSDIVVTGGTEACVMPLAVSSFFNMRALSRRIEFPEQACCPFSSERDGFVMAEGSVMFVLEERESALRRGAKIYAEILGGAGTCDAYHITAPHETGEGAARAMSLALKRSKLNPEDIQYVHAHGTSTPLNDARETLAIKSAFGDFAYKLWISSTKSMTGHMIGSAGPMGVLASIKTLNTKIVAPTINYQKPDPECDLDYVPNQAREGKHIQHVMINSLGFGGHNTCLILGASQN